MLYSHTEFLYQMGQHNFSAILKVSVSDFGGCLSYVEVLIFRVLPWRFYLQYKSRKKIVCKRQQEASVPVRGRGKSVEFFKH